MTEIELLTELSKSYRDGALSDLLISFISAVLFIAFLRNYDLLVSVNINVNIYLGFFALMIIMFVICGISSYIKAGKAEGKIEELQKKEEN